MKAYDTLRFTSMNLHRGGVQVSSWHAKFVDCMTLERIGEWLIYSGDRSGHNWQVFSSYG